MLWHQVALGFFFSFVLFSFLLELAGDVPMPVAVVSLSIPVFCGRTLNNNREEKNNGTRNSFTFYFIRHVRHLLESTK